MSYNDFINMGKPWSSEDDTKLLKLYNEDLLDILNLSNIFKRAPGGISARLQKLNIIPDKKLARGYEDYLNSDLYKEACLNSKNKKKQNLNINSDEDVNSDEDDNINDFIKSFNKLTKFKNEIIKIQNTLKIYIKNKNDCEKKIKILSLQNEELKNVLTNQNNELKKEINEHYINYDNSNIILINDKEYLLIDDIIYKINKIKGDVYGTYNKTTNKVIKNKI